MADSNTEREAQESEDLAAIVSSAHQGTEQALPSEEVEAHPSTRPTRSEIEFELARLSRSPFRRILADVMECAPTMKAMRRLAENKPDKYFAALSQISAMAGYTKDTVVEHNVNFNIGNLNDTDLELRMREVQLKLAEQQKLITQPVITQPKIAEGASYDPNIIDVPSKQLKNQ